jgi:hypothetical protein
VRVIRHQRRHDGLPKPAAISLIARGRGKCGEHNKKINLDQRFNAMGEIMMLLY